MIMSFRLLAFSTAMALSMSVTAATVGAPAPDFSLPDSNGKTHALSEYKGKTVVLEWNNPECPFVKKHYSSGNIPKQQSAAIAEGAVWLVVNSGADGKQGHVAGNAASAFLAQYDAKPTAYLLDADGKVGHAYG